MGNTISSHDQGIDVNKDIVQTARDHFESILQESNGNLYGAQLEVAFIEMIKSSSYVNTKFRALVKENLFNPPIIESPNQAEEEPAAPKLLKVEKSKHLSQGMIIIPEEVDYDALKESEEIVNWVPDDKIKLSKNKDILVNSFEIVRNRNSFKFLVAVDGHTESETAFQVAMSLKKAADHIELLHIYSESDQKDVLKLSKLHRQKAIYTKYDTMVATSHVDQKNVVFSWICKEDDTSSREVLLDHLKTASRIYHVHLDDALKQAAFNDAANEVNVVTDDTNKRKKKVAPNIEIIDGNNAVFSTNPVIASPSTKNSSFPEIKSSPASTPVKINCAAIMEKCQHPVDFVVLGHTGRKAALKQNNKMLNSVVNFALYDIKTTVILANTAPNNNARQSGKKVVMAVNESESSKRGLSILLTLIHPNDTLVLIFADNERENTHSAANAIFDQFGTNKVRQVQSYYEKELALFGPKNSSFIILNVYTSNAPEQIESKLLSYGSTSLSSKSQLVGNTAEELTKLSPRSVPPLSPIDASRVQFSARTSRYTESKQNLNNGAVLASSSARDTGLCLTARDEHRSTVSAKDFHSSTATNRFGDNNGDGDSKPKVPVLSFSSKVLGSETLSFLPPIDSARIVHTAREGNKNSTTDDVYSSPRKPIFKLSYTAQVIVDYINVSLADSPPDFFAIAPRPRSAVISYCYITESIISQLDCNIIICKDSK